MSEGGAPRLPPGGTLGILGGGQLGRMIANDAQRMGYKVAILDPDPKGAAPRIADRYVEGAFSDLKGALAVAEASDVVTLETEHIPSEVLYEVEKVRTLRPSADELHTIQDRLRQKEFLKSRGFPQPEFHAVESARDLERGVEAMLAKADKRAAGSPPLAILKSRRGGYDGKGQIRIARGDDLAAAWSKLGVPAVLEAFVPFVKEVSVVLARGLAGEIRYYPLAENVHRRGILHTTRVPADVPAGVESRAREIASGIAHAFEHVGVMAVEMFLLADGGLLVNEIAPRVHNSGHFTLGACATSQFEQHLRAVVGLPLGDPRLLSPAVMLNVLGDAWVNGEPRWDVVHAEPGARLHLYGKARVAPGRKMGHVTILDSDPDRALAIAENIHARLPGEPRRAP